MTDTPRNASAACLPTETMGLCWNLARVESSLIAFRTQGMKTAELKETKKEKKEKLQFYAGNERSLKHWQQRWALVYEMWPFLFLWRNHFSPLFVAQVYDLASPGESVDSAPGCRLTDGVCVTAAGPSCGVHASCLADWGSFSCECHPGYTGHKCDRGERQQILKRPLEGRRDEFKCLSPPHLEAVPESSFDSNSVMRFQLRGGGSSRRTNIQLLLRTRAMSGTLLSVASRDASEYIVLEVSPHLGASSLNFDLSGRIQHLKFVVFTIHKDCIIILL